MSNSNSNSQQSRPEENHAKERKRCIFSKLDAVEELLLEMSQTHSKIQKLTSELEEIQKSEIHSSHRSLGSELDRLTTNGGTYVAWSRGASRDVKFVKECVSLRYNDENVTCVDFARADDYRYILGDCLIQNTRVVDLTVLLSQFSGHHDRDTCKSFQAVLHYVRTSSALRCLRVKGYYHARDLDNTNTIELLDAIGSNPNIEEIELREYIPPISLYRVLVESPTCQIKALIIECGDYVSNPMQERLLMPQAIAKCSSLVNLRLKSDSYNWSMIQCILNHMADANTPLEELSLEGYQDTYLQSLKCYLQVTMTLQRLELRRFNLRTENVQSILECLRQHYTSPTACIGKFGMIECDFDEQATDNFTEFLNTTGYSAILQELELSFGYSQHPNLSGAIAKCLVYPPALHSTRYQWHKSNTDVWNNTVGSGLKTLKLHDMNYSRHFCEYLKANVNYIYLPCLHISNLRNKECLQVASCIPRLLSLQELHLGIDDRGISVHVLLLSMIQQCGNLCMVSIQDDKGRAYLDDSQSYIATAFCDRNRMLFMLFSKTIHWNWESEHDSASHKNSSLPKTLNIQDYDIALLLPMLLHVAKQVPVTKVGTIMKALLNLVVEGIQSI